MNKQTECPECHKPLPAGSTHNLCPACLMAQVMAPQTLDSIAGDGAETLPPCTAEEIADKFPQFEMKECLGRGGMGVVYKARQKSLDRWVAIKVLAPERIQEARFAEHFEHEAKTLARMSHPNIVTVFDHGETDGLFYIVMEFVDGVNLRDLLRDGKMMPEQALAIVPPICEALEYAHEKGVVHRDIKPENILIDREGRVKIADFGIATLVGTSCEKSGTPAYMAPEQEKGIVDRRADIYALGAVFYEMLTGERPTNEWVAPSKRVAVDGRIDEIVMRALEKEPDLRFQTAAELNTMLQTVAGSPANQHTGKSTAAIKPITPRFSRMAIIGICWAPCFIIMFILSMGVTVVTTGHHETSWLQYLVRFTVFPLGLTAPFGTTILGWMAVSKIRRSEGKLYGLWLAVLDGLLYPLLLLVALIGWFWSWVFCDLIRDSILKYESSPSMMQRIFIDNAVSLTLVTTLLTSLILGFYIIRRVWRAVNR